MPDGALAALRELEHADQELGSALVELDRLTAELEAVRAGTQELQGFLSGLPAERERRAAELERARAEVSAADQAQAEAEHAVRTARPEAEREAERFAVRARDRVSVARRRAAEAGAAVGDLEDQVGEATIRADHLQAQARKLAAELRGRPRVAEDAGKEPGEGVEGVTAWSEVARAALFVARGQLAAEQDALIRQANEIGALALGEPLSAMGTGALARRVEQGLARGNG